jgi:hypothetical protein
MFGFCTFHLEEYLGPASNVPLRAVYDNVLLAVPTTVWLLGLTGGWIWLLRRREKWSGLLTVAIIIPVLVGVALTVSWFPVLREKHLAVIWGPSLLVGLRVLGLLRRSRAGWIVIGCYVAVCGVSIFHFVFQPNEYSRRDDWTGLRRELEARVERGSVVMAYNKWMLRRPESGRTIVPAGVREIDVSVRQ